MSDVHEQPAADWPPPDPFQWRPSEKCEVPMFHTLVMAQRLAGFTGEQARNWAFTSWQEIVASHARWTDLLGGAHRPLSPGAVKHLVDLERDVNARAATVLGQRAAARAEPTSSGPRRKRRKRGGRSEPDTGGGAGGETSMPWDVGHTKHRLGTGIAVAQRALEDPIGELARHTVQPMHHLGGEILMCCAPTCRAVTEMDRCVACKGADLTDHMVCTGCGEHCEPSALHLDVAHTCGGSWQPCDGMSHQCSLCGGPASPSERRVLGWFGLVPEEQR